jgi:Mce-associated membrane protein
MTILDESTNGGAAAEPAGTEAAGGVAPANPPLADPTDAPSGAGAPSSTPGAGPVTAGGAAKTPRSTATQRWFSGHLSSVVLSLVVGLIVLTLAGALVVTTRQLQHRNAVDSARSTALSAAKVYAIELASYNYHSLNADFGQVIAHSTPEFAASFNKSSSDLKSFLTKYDATAKASVVATGVVSATTGRAVVLIFLDQTVTNTTQKKGTTTQSRVEMTLLHSRGRWLINAVSLL